MRLAERSMTFLTAAILTLGLVVQPLYAQDNEAAEKRMARLQLHMDEMAKDMDAINAESDPEKRRSMLHDHMEEMHEAITMMQTEMLPSMRRKHRHKQRPPVSSSDDAAEYDAEEHMETMDEMMTQMESLMEQMSQHRRAMRDSQ